MKKIFIVTRSGHSPTVNAIKEIVEKICGKKISECNTYSGAPLMFPSFILNNIDNDSFIVIVEESKCTVIEKDNLEEAIESLQEHLTTPTYITLFKLVKFKGGNSVK